jgi:LysM repeat protein
MFFFYSRKLQVVMLLLWCAGTAVMYTAVIGGGPDFFSAGKDAAPVENAAARVGTMPEPARPAPSPPPPAPTPPPPAEDNYVVREGDTVIKIAARHGLDPESIIERNRLTHPDLLRPGDTLVIPAPGEAQAKVRHTPHGMPKPAVHGQNGTRHGAPPSESPAATPGGR